MITRKEHQNEMRKLKKIAAHVIDKSRKDRNAFGKTTNPYIAKDVKSSKIVFAIVEATNTAKFLQDAKLVVIKADNDDDIGKEFTINMNSTFTQVLKDTLGSNAAGLLIEDAFIGVRVTQHPSHTVQDISWVANDERRWPN